MKTYRTKLASELVPGSVVKMRTTGKDMIVQAVNVVDEEEFGEIVEVDFIDGPQVVPYLSTERVEVAHETLGY